MINSTSKTIMYILCKLQASKLCIILGIKAFVFYYHLVGIEILIGDTFYISFNSFNIKFYF